MNLEMVLDAYKMAGNEFWLVSIKPNEKNGELLGYKYIVSCVDRDLEKISVKIPGKQLIPSPEKGAYIPVSIKGLTAEYYLIDGKQIISFNATGIEEVKGS